MKKHHKRCFILDLDGTVYLGDIPIEKTVAYIREHWAELDFYFLSNNTSKSPSSYLKKLHSLGIMATSDQLLSPTTPLVSYLIKNGIGTVYLVGNTDYHKALHEAMPELTFARDDNDGAEAVILAYDTELTYEKLTHAGRLLLNPQVRYLATHPDLVCPAPAGSIPDVGSFIALFNAAYGRMPEKIFGKPEPAVLEPLFEKYAREEMVMVGDRLATDKKLAENAGIDAIVVLSGEATRETVKQELTPPWRVLEHLGELDHF